MYLTFYILNYYILLLLETLLYLKLLLEKKYCFEINTYLIKENYDV